MLGIGEHARRNILPAIAQCRRVALAGIASRNAAVVAEESRRYGCAGYPSPEAVCHDDRVDVVFICLPVGLHAEWALRCLNAGKHVWCEKSLAATRRDWNLLVDRAEQQGRSLCEGFMFLHHRQFRRVLEILRADELGRIRSFTARFGFPSPAPDNVRYSKPLGGGALLDAGCYAIRAAIAIGGADTEVCASSLVTEPERAVDTGGAALVKCPSGAHGFLDWGFGRTYCNQLEIWGEKAECLVDRAFSKPAHLETTVAIRAGAQDLRTEAIPADNHFVTMLETFAGTIADRERRAAEWATLRSQGRLLFDVQGDDR
ncbi:MAG: Gfo/Idh/MocA family oxidoreductase [Deltaproteobacteria bacterium]|nr:Gfo/Idh/MocA family oxidoreductase [Deltaproteobacteria bacterium]